MHDSLGGQSTIPLFTDSQSVTNGSPSKNVHVYVDKDIEFTIPISNDQHLTCGWLLSEVTRRYLDALNYIKL